MKRFILSLLALAGVPALFAQDKPNILWITNEDHGPHMGCYGDSYATTPNLDAVAAKGMLFNHAWSNAPVCAAARTTLIVGMYGPSTGGQHMRSMVPMPKGKKMYPQFLREAGYYCTNHTKEDYNLEKPDGVWDDTTGKAHWKNRPEGAPFFAIFNCTLSHESKLRVRPHKAIHDPTKVRVPAYHPDTPEVRQDWAQYYDTVTQADAEAGKVLAEVEEAGLAGNTIVFFYADHGSGMARNKRWPSNSGLHVPMIVYFPEKWKHLAPKEYTPGGQSDRLVSFVDLAPTLLSIVGIEPPEWMQGNAFAGTFQTEPPAFMHGFRGRMDERYDMVRSVTDGRYVYLRNYMPHLSQGQHVNYQFATPSTEVWRAFYDAGKLNAAQSRFWNTPKDSEELYDLETDPDEVLNLVNSVEHQAILKRLREAMKAYVFATRDTGFLQEGEMHRRAAGESPYDMAHDEDRYPLVEIFEAAELASTQTPDDLDEVKALLAGKDPAVRYWGATGALIRGKAAVEATSDTLASMVNNDDNPQVRIAAAWALAEHGAGNAQKNAAKTLLDLANWEQTKNVFTSLAALTAIDNLTSSARPDVASVKALPTKGESPDGRYGGYIGNLVSSYGWEKGEAGGPSTKKGKGKGKK